MTTEELKSGNTDEYVRGECPDCRGMFTFSTSNILHVCEPMVRRLIRDRASLQKRVEDLERALNKIRSTNGLQYSDIFEICDEALSAQRT